MLEFLFVNTMVGTLEAETSVWNKMENIRIILVKKLFSKSAANFSLLKPFQTLRWISIYVLFVARPLNVQKVLGIESPSTSH